MTKDIDLPEEHPDRPVETMHPTEMTREEEPKMDDTVMHNEPQPQKRLSLFGDGNVDELRSRWNTIQAQFVDQPCTSIEQADALIAEVVHKINQNLTDQHNYLRKRWYDHEDTSTEELRLTLQDYRSYFNNLLNQ